MPAWLCVTPAPGPRETASRQAWRFQKSCNNEPDIWTKYRQQSHLIEPAVAGNTLGADGSGIVKRHVVVVDNRGGSNPQVEPHVAALRAVERGDLELVKNSGLNSHFDPTYAVTLRQALELEIVHLQMWGKGMEHQK